MVAPAETDVLQRLIDGRNGDLPAEVARTVLSWKFADTDQTRLTELSAKARSGTLSPDESRQLDWYLLLGDFLTILQSKARTSLRKNPTAA